MCVRVIRERGQWLKLKGNYMSRIGREREWPKLAEAVQ